MTPVCSRLRSAAAVAVAALFLTAAPRAAQPTPKPLGGVGALQTWFNANKTHPKAILLLSPT